MRDWAGTSPSKYRKVVVVFWFLVMGILAHAQEKTISRDNQQWVQYTAVGKINSRWSVLGYLGYRWEDSFKDNYIYVAKVAGYYTFENKLKLSAGFTQMGYFSGTSIYKYEFRPYEELSFKSSFSQLTISHRFRLEERIFVPRQDAEKSSSKAFNYRFRYAVNFSFPIARLSASHQERRLLFNVGDEIQINAGKQIVYNVFDKNRFTIGPTVVWNEHFSYTLMWNNQFASSSTAGHYVHTNAIWLKISDNFDFNKKAK